ncbi:FAD-binding oxidoreductase [Aminomonas paucivorans]|uniref:FAD-binding oxidoreductase n=1 Tax=Aminomonas paucivorans TaxID=81412 RepID=UPI00331E3B68
MEERQPYGSVTAKTLRDLAELVGPRNVSGDPEKLAAYSHDEVPSASLPEATLAQALVFPESTEHVSLVMAYADRHRIPVTPRGAGTGLSGGAVPACGGILLSFEKMNRILDLDRENLTVTVEPGVVTAEINRAAAKHRLLYAGDPCSGDASFIGGNVAENAGGNKVIKYGATGAQVLGLEAVLADGSVTWFGGKRRKDVTGYDFVHLLAGSEGTLAVITKIILRLLPLPKHTTDLLAPFGSVEEALGFVPRIVIEAGLLPASVELLDRRAVEVAMRYLNAKLPEPDAAAHLLIQLEGNDPEVLADEVEKVGDLCLAHGARQVYVADNRTARDKLWKARKAVPEAIVAFHSRYAKEDVVVPTGSVPTLMVALEEVDRAWGVEHIAYGHVGDGNMHVTLLPPEGPEGPEKLREARHDLYRRVAALGGTLSGEHGIGLKRRDDTPLFLDEAQLALIRRVKAAFDPKGILNPRKIVPGN